MQILKVNLSVYITLLKLNYIKFVIFNYICTIVFFIIANTRTLMKMVAEIQLQIKDVIQRIDRITPTVKIVSSIEEIKKYLPLKLIEDIRNIETRLKEENFVNE